MIYKIAGSIALILALVVVVAWNVHATVSTERTFNAPIADVWRVWNDPKSIERWWGPKDYTALVAPNDVRAGGSYLLAMKSKQGRLSWNTGTYREVLANKRIVSTMSFSDASGQVVPGSKTPVPGRWPNEIDVLVDFSEAQGKTKVTLTEVGIPLIVYPLMKMGWAQQFDKIQALL